MNVLLPIVPPLPPIVPRPVLFTLSPPAGPAGTTTVTITGRNFLPGSTVTIDGFANIVPTSITSTSITFVVPVGVPLGAQTVTVVGPNGVSNPGTFTVTSGPPPTTPACALVATQPNLVQFAVLGASTVTNTGPTIVTLGTAAPASDNVGVFPGSAITGFPPGIVNEPGTLQPNTTLAMNAQTEANTLFNALATGPCTVDLTGQNLGGLTLTPGIYCFSTGAQLTGTLTLNAEGNPSASFIFRTGSTLTTASNATIALINGAQACNVFFRVGSSATLGTSTTFNGTIVAQASITANTSASVNGRLIALTAAVTLDSNTITIPACTSCP